MPMKISAIATFLGACTLLTAGYLHAATVRFTGADVDNNLFSNGNNWIDHDTSTTPYHPVAGDALPDFYSGSTSASNRAKVDARFVLGSGDGTGRLGSTAIKQLTGGAGTAYLEVLSGGTLHATSLVIGQRNYYTRMGDVIIRKGGTLIGGNNANGGFLELANQSGNTLTIEAGAVYGGSLLIVGENSVLEVQAGANAISTFISTYTDTNVRNNIIDCVLRLDLGALTSTGSFKLVDSQSSGQLIDGNLKVWLDGSSTPGTRSGMGNFTSTYFEIINASSALKWSLTTADGGQDLVLNITSTPGASSTALDSGGFTMR